MKKRILSAAVMIACCVLCIPFEISRVFLIWGISLVCAYEVCINFDRKLDIKVKAWVLYVYLSVLPVLALTHCGIMTYYALFTFAVFFSMVSGMLNKEVFAKGTIYTLAALTYPCFPLSFVIIVAASARWLEAILLGAVSCLLCDAFALFGGMLFGKHKLAPNVSPKKTIEGSICGSLFSMLYGVIVWLILKRAQPLPLIPCVVTALVASIAGQIGDLVESMLKRYLNVKDMSNLIPGHGGMMDRVDSSIFAIPAAYFCLYLFGL